MDGVTGELVERGDVEGLARAIARYASDPDLCDRQGKTAFERVQRVFDHEKVFQALAAHPDTAHLLARAQAAHHSLSAC